MVYIGFRAETRGGLYRGQIRMTYGYWRDMFTDQ